ncbi:hypothetical protein PR202_ga21887 [Eleusine coracana subsp. coracana]|uniref:Uncharacterized protein n=1 Tax=Eleusine coracana subsp. coracana TaxID=191504 RepID=A0AAV5D152_ELECO|nr:hypothetical protein PR202_ga21887 [Eleusine coracana subsp. coracana]
MVRPTPKSGFSYIVRRFGQPGAIPLLWPITYRSSLIRPFGFGSHLSQRDRSPLGETLIVSS